MASLPAYLSTDTMRLLHCLWIAAILLGTDARRANQCQTLGCDDSAKNEVCSCAPDCMSGDEFNCCDDYVLTCVLGFATVVQVGPETGQNSNGGTPINSTDDGGAGDGSEPSSPTVVESVVLEDCPAEIQSDATSISVGIR